MSSTSPSFHLTKASASLSARAKPAAIWVFTGMALNNVIRLLSNLLLSRLLAPDLYGLMSIGNVIVGALILLSDIGLAQAVVQNPRGQEPRFLNTIWTIRFVRGLILSGIMLAIAGSLALMDHFLPTEARGTYGDSRLITVLLVLAIFPITDGFESTNLLLCRRAVNLMPIVTIDVGSQILATVLMAAAALWHPSVWILPTGWVCYSLFKSLGSFFISGPGNRFEWDSPSANEIWHFSKWILISSTLTFAYREGDRVVLGSFLSASEMGIYGVSILLLGAVKAVVGSLSGAVGLPALAEISRSRPLELRRAYRRCRLPIDAICLATAGLMFGAAPLIIRILYDQRYQDAAPIFRLLSLILISHRYVVFDDFLVATGSTRQLFKRGVLQVIVLLLALPLGYHLGGMQGAVVGVLAANFSTVPLILYLEAKSGVFDWKAELKVVPIFLATAAIGYGLTWLSQSWWHIGRS